MIRIKPRKIIPLFLIPLASAIMLIVYAFDVSLSDSFHFSDTIKIPTKLLLSDSFVFRDAISFFSPLVHAFSDAFHMFDAFGISNIITVITTTLTSIITQIGTGTCVGSCYNNGDAITTIVIPAILLVVTGFGFMFMGVKAFGVFILVESFVLMMIAYIGIVPSWFILFVIIFVSAGLTRIVLGFLRGNG